MVNPCKNCPNKGCGPYHDECADYQEYTKEKKLDRKDINKNKNFARSEFRPTKGRWPWGKYKNLGY